jgi:hypothetical protein
MADLADHAYGHALAVVGDAAVAAELARRGLLRGGRSRVAVLGHTRAAALGAAASEGAGVSARSAPATVTEAALALAWRRPAVERAVVDLDGRHGLARGGFARALGLSPADAAALAGSVGQAWSADLDPALLAWLGPGDCEGLAEVLGPSTGADMDVDGLLAAASAVAGHAEVCEVCADRRRAMVSVRSVLAQLPLPAAPPELRAAGRAARRRPPVPPPALGQDRAGPWLRGALVAASIAAVALLVAGIVGLVSARDRGRNGRVEALTALPSGAGSLALSRTSFDATTNSVVVTNRAVRRLRWDSSATVQWVRTMPSTGELDPGESVTVGLRLLDTAPEGDITGTVTFTAADGSTASLAGAGTIERAPDVAAHRVGCEVTATAEDEGRVAAVLLHWRDGAGAEGGNEMQAGPSGSAYHDGLPPSAVLWWVTAADARGNLSHTPDEQVAPPAC